MMKKDTAFVRSNGSAAPAMLRAIAAVLAILILAASALTQENQAPASSSPDQKSAVSALKESLDPKPQQDSGKSLQFSDWRDNNEGLEGTGIKMLQALAICCGVFLVGIHFYKKYTGQGPVFNKNRRMRILERLPVSPKSALLLVEVDGKKVLIGVGSENVSHIPLREVADQGEFGVSLDEVCAEDLKASAS
jgi:hypothetical protein